MVGGLSKLNSVGYVEVDIRSRRAQLQTAEAVDELGAPGVIAPESLERR